MLARVRSGALMGIDAVVVECEVDMALGLPYFNVVGLPGGGGARVQGARHLRAEELWLRAARRSASR